MRKTARRPLLSAALLAVPAFVAACGDPPLPAVVPPAAPAARIDGAPAPADPLVGVGDVAKAEPAVVPPAPKAPDPTPPAQPETTARAPVPAPPAVTEPQPSAPPSAPTPATSTTAPTAPAAAPTATTAAPTATAAAPTAPAASASGEGPKPSDAAKPADPAPAAAGDAAKPAPSGEHKSLLPKDRKKDVPVVLNWEQLASFDYIPPPPVYPDPETGVVPDQSAEVEKAKRQIPEEIWELDGALLEVEGFMIPLEYADDGVKAFLISRHAMGCCFGVMPRPHELIECDMGAGKSVPYVSYVPVKVVGLMHVGPKDGPQSVLSGIYRMDAPKVIIPKDY